MIGEGKLPQVPGSKWSWTNLLGGLGRSVRLLIAVGGSSRVCSGEDAVATGEASGLQQDRWHDLGG